MIDEKIKHFLINEFSVHVRDYAIKREANIDCGLPSINEFYPELVTEVKNLVDGNKYFIRDYLTHKDWAYIIYISYFTLENGESLLLKNFPLFNATNAIKRGGLNLYKRDGWCTHVITGLFISNICIPEKTTPLSIPNTGGETDLIFELTLPTLFSQLDADDIFLYRVGTLIHDLGVIDGVENHDFKGIKYVKPALIQLGIDNNWLLKNKFNWHIDELTFALELFVGQHSFLSKVYSEFGLHLIREVLKTEFSSSKINSVFLESWVQKKSLLSLALFIIGDIGAVREELLNLQTLKKIVESEILLNKLLNEQGNKDKDDFLKYGLNRLKEFLETENETTILNLISNSIEDTNSFLQSVGRIQRLDYFLTYIKQISNNSDRIVFLNRLIVFLNENTEWNKFENQELNFSPHVSMNLILSICNAENNDWKKDLLSHIQFSNFDEKMIAKFNE
jgi:hypothetical protein